MHSDGSHAVQKKTLIAFSGQPWQDSQLLRLEASNTENESLVSEEVVWKNWCELSLQLQLFGLPMCPPHG